MGNWTRRTVKVLCATLHNKVNGKIESFYHLPITGTATIHYTPNDKYVCGIGPGALMEFNGLSGMKEIVGCRKGLDGKYLVYQIDFGEYEFEIYTDITEDIMCPSGEAQERAQKQIEISVRRYGQEIHAIATDAKKKYFGRNVVEPESDSNSEELKLI